MRVLANLNSKDYRANKGNHIHQIAVECGERVQQTLTAMRIVKEVIAYFRIPQTEKWRIGIIIEVLEANMEFPFSADQVKGSLIFLCTT